MQPFSMAHYEKYVMHNGLLDSLSHILLLSGLRGSIRNDKFSQETTLHNCAENVGRVKAASLKICLTGNKACADFLINALRICENLSL